MAKEIHGDFFGDSQHVQRNQNKKQIYQLKLNRIVVNLFGPTSIGKGYTTKQLVQYFCVAFGHTVDIISTGDLVRKKFQSDPDFESTWAPVVARGDLVPNHIMIPMYDDHLHTSPNNGFMLVNDGFPRDREQIGHASELGLMGENSLTILLRGSRNTCFMRAQERLIKKPDGKRIDENSFDKRFRDYHLELDGNRCAINKKTKTRLIQLDANRPLPEVASDVLSFVALMIAEHCFHIQPSAPIPSRLPAPALIPGAVLI